MAVEPLTNGKKRPRDSVVEEGTEDADSEESDTKKVKV